MTRCSSQINVKTVFFLGTIVNSVVFQVEYHAYEDRIRPSFISERSFDLNLLSEQAR